MVQAVGNVIFGADTRTLAEVQADQIAAAGGVFTQQLAAGYAVSSTQAIAIDDGSRANLTGMALTGTLSLQSGTGVTWPPSYQQGWICIDGSHLALPTAQDGIALAFGAGVYYSEMAQAEQAVCNTIAAATTIADALAVNLTQGYPT